MPTRNPRPDPRRIGAIDSRHSCRVGISSEKRGEAIFSGTPFTTVDRISPSPNRPTATGTMPMPSPSSLRSNA